MSNGDRFHQQKMNILKDEYFEKVYKPRLEDGREFQDFAIQKLAEKKGIHIYVNTSRKYQMKHGENKAGYEIKHDRFFKSTRRLWIEIAEKSNPFNANYYDSGIFSTPPPVYYLIGDYFKFFVFDAALLRRLRRTREIVDNSNKTSKAFYLYEKEAEEIASYVIQDEGSTPPRE